MYPAISALCGGRAGECRAQARRPQSPLPGGRRQDLRINCNRQPSAARSCWILPQGFTPGFGWIRAFSQARREFRKGGAARHERDPSTSSRNSSKECSMRSRSLVHAGGEKTYVDWAEQRAYTSTTCLAARRVVMRPRRLDVQHSKVPGGSEGLKRRGWTYFAFDLSRVQPRLDGPAKRPVAARERTDTGGFTPGELQHSCGDAAVDSPTIRLADQMAWRGRSRSTTIRLMWL